MGKHSSLLQTFVNYGRKKFYKIGPRSGGSTKIQGSLWQPRVTVPLTSWPKNCWNTFLRVNF